MAKVFPGGPAARAGIRANDEVVSVNGERLFSTAALGGYMAAHPGELRLVVVRGGEKQPQTISMTPEIPVGQKEYRIGLVWDPHGKMGLIFPTPLEQVRDTVDSMKNTLGSVFSPKSGIGAQHLSGPIGILRYLYILFVSQDGWRLVLWFSVFLNINLAIMNLLPIPILDGGHIVMAVIEAIRRRPLSLRTLEFVNSACAAVVIGFLAYVTFFDLQDLPWKRHAKEAAPSEMKFAPEPAAAPATPSAPAQPKP